MTLEWEKKTFQSITDNGSDAFPVDGRIHQADNSTMNSTGDILFFGAYIFLSIALYGVRRCNCLVIICIVNFCDVAPYLLRAVCNVKQQN